MSEDRGPRADDDPSEGISASATPPADDLPQDYVLTPEDVEDEAIRGDFVLRWAVTLLAVLLACTALVESEPLLGVASGRYLAGEGYWPHVSDPFSLATEGRAWANPHWLFDLFRAGVVWLGGFALLTFWTALKAGGLAWSVQQTARPGVPTWFTSVCAALMLLACCPVLVPTPDLITVLCCGSVFWIDAEARNRRRPNLRWAWAAVLLVQTNMDAHAWVTLLMVVGLAVRGRLANAKDAAVGPCLAAAAAWVANPFPLATLRRPLEQYRHHYPELAAYGPEEPFASYLLRPIWFPEFWAELSPFAGAALLLSVLALVLVMLDRSSRLGGGVLWLLANGPAVLCGHQWPAASVANAALAGWAAQGWYAANFSQTYTTRTGELLWSRGGRAATVLGLVVVAGLMITGRLGLADDRRLGLGLSDELDVRVRSTAAMLRDAGGSVRPFHFRLEQGDVLAYVGGRNIVDHRVGLFAPEVTRGHRASRGELLAGEKPQLLVDLQCDAAVPRLYGPDPDYRSLIGLAIRDWSPQRLWATGVLMRPPGVETDGYFPAAIVAGDALPADLTRPTWPIPPTVYDRVYNRPPPVSGEQLLASHYAALVRQVAPTQQNRVQTQRGAMAAVRLANVALNEDLTNVSAWSSLATGYGTARRVEASVGMPQVLADIRTAQELSALVQWGLAASDDPRPALLAYALYEAEGRKDAALAAWQDASDRLTRSPETVDPPPELDDLIASVARVRAEVGDMTDEPPARRAAEAMAGGCPRLAVEVLSQDLTQMAGDADAATLYAAALLQSGQFERADGFLSINAQTQAARFLRVQTALSRADYAAAEAEMATQILELPPQAAPSFEATRMLWDLERGLVDAARLKAAGLIAGEAGDQIKQLASFVTAVAGPVTTSETGTP